MSVVELDTSKERDNEIIAPTPPVVDDLVTTMYESLVPMRVGDFAALQVKMIQLINSQYKTEH